MKQGKKIGAIKLYREKTGVGLKEAKDFIEALAADQGIAASSRSGCLGVVVLLVLIPLAAVMRNEDSKGVAHYPGWSLPVLKYLYEERKITASGHETTDTDPGIATSKDDYSLETYILGTDHYQIELLANLDQVPEAGAIVVATFPKPKGGSGFPARVFAIVP
jgi:kynurenine formamidase